MKMAHFQTQKNYVLNILFVKTQETLQNTLENTIQSVTLQFSWK